MKRLTVIDLLGWSAEEYALVDRRMEALARWCAANGRSGDVTRDVLARVAAWPDRTQVGVWRKTTISMLSSEIARAIARERPDVARNPVGAQILDAMSRGHVMDLDGFYVEAMDAIDLERDPDEALPLFVEALLDEVRLVPDTPGR